MSGGAPDDPRQYFTLGQVAAILGLSVRTVRREVQRGRFPRPVKFGARRLIVRAEFEELMQRKARERDGRIS